MRRFACGSQPGTYFSAVEAEACAAMHTRAWWDHRPANLPPMADLGQIAAIRHDRVRLQLCCQRHSLLGKGSMRSCQEG